MKRTCIFLTPQQIAKLEKLAKKTGLKVSELIRRFIDAGLEKA
jgi:predicted DNA-binding protein